MKTITSIRGIQVKGKNFSHPLQPVVIVTGENASGKTALVDAIRIGTLGYLPSLGKLPGKTIALAPDMASTMEVELNYSDGATTRRSFTRTKTGASAKEEGFMPSVSEAQLDFSAFLSAKPTERHAILSSLMGVVDTAALTQKLTAEVAKLGLSAFRFALAACDGNPISPLVAKVAEQGRAVKQSTDQARKTLATLVETAIPDPVEPAKLAEAREAHQQALKDVGAAQGALDALKRKSGPVPTEPAAPEDDEEVPDGLKEELEGKLRAARTALNDASQKLGAATAQAEEMKRRQATVLAEPPAMTEPSEEEMANAEMECDEHDAALAELTEQIRSAAQEAQQLTASIATLDEHHRCPVCLSEGEHLAVAHDALVGMRDALLARVKELTLRRQDETLALEKVNAVIGGMVVSLEAWNAYRAAMGTLPTEEEVTACKTLLETATAAKAQLEADIATMTGELDEVNGALKNHAAWTSYRAIMATLPSAEAVAAAEAKATEADVALAQAASKLSGMQTAQDEYNRAVADMQRIADLKKEADTNEATAKNIEVFKKWLQGEERAATAAAMKPVLDVAGVFLDGIVDGELAIREHQLGVSRDGMFLPLEVLSGMETAAVAAACQSAMAGKSEVRIILVDELGRMRDRQALKFLENCQAAVKSGIVDQIVLVDPHGGRYPGELVLTIA
jgi:DNA repair exonuclease SbcCD ATPase subunit